MVSFWSELCHEDAFQLWVGSVPGFCFRNLLNIVILFKLIVTDFYYIGKHKNEAVHRRPFEAQVSAVRMGTCVLVLLSSIVHLSFEVAWNESLPLLGYIKFATQIITWIVHVIFLKNFCCGFGYGIRGPLPVMLCFVMTLVVNAFNLHTSVVLMQSHSKISKLDFVDISCVSAITLFKVIYLLTFVKSPQAEAIISDDNGINSERQPLIDSPTSTDDLGLADDDASFFSRLIFAWVWKLMWKGEKLLLKTSSDLFRLPKSMQVMVNEAKFETSIQKVSKNNSKTSLFRSLLKTFGVEFFLLAIPRIIADILQFVGPVLLGYIVTFVETGNEPMLNGYLYALGMFASTFGASLINNHFNYAIKKLSIKATGALSCVIFKKTLSISSSSLSKLSSGEIIDMMSTDVGRIIGFQYFHYFWSLPLQIVIALYLVYYQLGIAFVACIIYALFLVPISQFLCHRIMTYEAKFMEFKDERIKLIGEVLKGFRVIKYSAWNDAFETKINNVRLKELKQLKYSKYLDALCVYFWQTTPLIMTISSFTVYILLGHELTAAKVFTCIALFDLLLIPLNAFPWVVGGLLESWVSFKRVQKLFELPDLIFANYYKFADEEKNGELNLSNGCFRWKELTSATDDKQFELSDISLQCHQGQLIGIIGKVGAGKSSLFCSILGEMLKTDGTIEISQVDRELGFGLFMQEAWVQHGTIRDNILFGKEYDHRFYNSIIEACALSDDLATFPHGDMTQVGENGITLSGGQKSRLTLARAIYQDKNIYLLDDPFAAVDADVATHIYKKCIRGLLKHKTVIVSTHHVKFLQDASKVVVINDGKITQQGNPSDILKVSTVVRMMSQDDSNLDESKTSDETSNKDGEQDKLIDDEEKESGAVRTSVYWTYWKAVGTFVSLLVFLSLLLMQASQNASELWLAHWVSSIKPKHNLSSNLIGIHMEDTVKFNLIVYGSIAAANSVFTLSRAFIFAYGCIQAAIVMHNKLLNSILKATMKFFEATPLGRVLNRFSTDLNNIDNFLPFILNIVLSDLFALLGAIFVIMYSLYWIVLVIVPLAIIYYFIQKFYRKTSREVKRISSISMSPVYTHFSESLSGAVTIRGFGETSRFVQDIRDKITMFLRANLTEEAASIWFSFQLEMLGVILVGAVSLFVVLQHHVSAASAGYVGLAITSALTINSLLCELVVQFTENEKLMVSVERVGQYLKNIEYERQDGILDPPESWPNAGIVEFDNVYLRYRENLPFVLKGINFQCMPGEKIGIVGRTGSGKSSTLSLLFSLVDHQMGDILVDGINVSHVPLQRLRSGLAIIPQDPFLFSGTVRENLDPTCAYADDLLWNALSLCQLENVIRDRPLGLDSDVGEQGREFSAGQRQLVCLARSILRNTKVLCIDEATASIDLDTDSIIQQAIRSVFKDSTVLTIAHRLDTIMHCDRIIVMADGEIIEFGSPQTLLNDEQSHFFALQEKS